MNQEGIRLPEARKSDRSVTEELNPHGTEGIAGRDVNCIRYNDQEWPVSEEIVVTMKCCCFIIHQMNLRPRHSSLFYRSAFLPVSAVWELQQAFEPWSDLQGMFVGAEFVLRVLLLAAFADSAEERVYLPAPDRGALPWSGSGPEPHIPC